MARTGIIATILSTTRVVINGGFALIAKVDPGGGALISPQVFLSPGEDSRPLDGDSLAGLPTPAAGRFVGVGSADPKNVGIATKGEVRRYSRNPDADDVITATLHLRADGSIEIKSVTGMSSIVMGIDGSIAGTNFLGAFTLQANGEMKINGATITTGGDVVTLNGNSLDGHSHPAQGSLVAPVGGGNVSGSTGASQTP